MSEGRNSSGNRQREGSRRGMVLGPPGRTTSRTKRVSSCGPRSDAVRAEGNFCSVEAIGTALILVSLILFCLARVCRRHGEECPEWGREMETWESRWIFYLCLFPCPCLCLAEGTVAWESLAAGRGDPESDRSG